MYTCVHMHECNDVCYLCIDETAGSIQEFIKLPVDLPAVQLQN